MNELSGRFEVFTIWLPLVERTRTNPTTYISWQDEAIQRTNKGKEVYNKMSARYIRWF